MIMSVVSITEARPVATGEAMRDILARQREAFLAAGPPTLQQRRADLRKLRRAIKDSAERIALEISGDFGNRARYETLLADVWPTLLAIRHAVGHLKGWMAPKPVSVGFEFLPARARILYQPVGVVGIISPWNYPFQLAIMPLIAALAAGNRVMLKPSELTPRTAQFLSEFLGGLFPAEQVAVVLGGPDAGAAFAALPFDHLFYTGSTAVGRQVMRAAAENLTPVTLELGGKSPCILAEDAQLPAAAESIVAGKLLNAGQTCIAPDYVLVARERREDFIKLVGEAVEKFYPKLAANPDYDSIVNDRHYQRVARYLTEARQQGARIVEFNPAQERLVPRERKLAPTLVVEPADELALMREEIFGPVLPVKSYGRIEEAIEYVNRRPRPLALYYFGTDEKQRDLVLEKTISGGVSVNETLLHVLIERLPFGGIGASGIGAYHGETGFQTFSHRKGVFLQSRFNGAKFLRPPFGRLTALMLKLLLSR
jgi:coniferyl-aldehyde dehydrogenase